MKNRNFESLLINVYANLNNIFRDEDNYEPIMKVNVEEINEDFFTAELIAMFMQFKKLTGQEVDIIDFTHILNKLAFQYIQDKDKESEVEQ